MEDFSCEDLVLRLMLESKTYEKSRDDFERSCWLAVHRHTHGFLPSEYDVREIPEELYLAVIAKRKEIQKEQS